MKQWTSSTFSDIGTVIAGQHIESAFYNRHGQGVPYLTGPDDFQEIVPTISKWTESPKVMAEDTDVLVTVKGAGVGKSNLSVKAAIGRQLMALRPDPNVLDRRFLFRFIQSREAEISRLGQGATVPGISKPAIAKMEIPLPPLSEQKRIADILDKADAIRRKRQEALRLNNDLIYSVYLDWFGNPITNPRGFPTRTIDEMCNLVRGSSPRPKSDPRYFGGPVPRLMVEDITRDGRLVTPRIDSLTEEGAMRSRPCPAGTVVMVVSGNVGLPARLAIDACIHDGFVGMLELDIRLIRPDFLVLTLEMLKVTHERFKAGAIWQNLTTHQIKAMAIPLPPLEQQDAFDQFVSRQNELKARLNYKGSEEEGLFNTLVQLAFRGEL